MMPLFFAFCVSASTLYCTEKTPSEENNQFFEAIQTGNIKKTKQLIKEGVDKNVTYTPYGLTAMHIAAALDKVKIVRLLIKENFPQNEKDNQGLIPLTYASFRGSYEIVELLIQDGVGCPSANQSMLTFIIAAKGGHLDIAKHILEKCIVKQNHVNLKTPSVTSQKSGCVLS